MFNLSFSRTWLQIASRKVLVALLSQTFHTLLYTIFVFYIVKPLMENKMLGHISSSGRTLKVMLVKNQVSWMRRVCLCFLDKL